MKVVGVPDQWRGLIDTLVPEILELILSSWRNMPKLAPGAREDPTTAELCRRLRQNRSGGDLPLRVDIQMVELGAGADADQGRMDIVFSPLVPTEEVYFCLECKRLNVVSCKGVRSYAGEYVTEGMVRFIRGQYAACVRHGGMLAYVLDGNIGSALAGVASSIRRRYRELKMQAPGEMVRSSIRASDGAIRETHHTRYSGSSPFCIHHIFAPARTC